MHNILILYNPYYQNDVIEQHLKILISNGKVAFGKIKSKRRDMINSHEAELEQIYESLNSNDSDGKYLQLFLTDYSNLFVAKVIAVTDEDMSEIAPEYYKEKRLDVEKWFIISDIRELVRNDFECVRDDYLANFTVSGHTYAVYGNAYVYPLIIKTKQETRYFEDDGKFYPEVYKSAEFLEIKRNLIRYCFGRSLINLMHPDSIENIISAEIEYLDNIANPLYDFSSVVVKYSKTMEQEIYAFVKVLMEQLAKIKPSILKIPYEVQGTSFTVSDIFENKPNLGTYKFLFKNRLIQYVLEGNLLQNYVTRTLPKVITELQDLRNETVHAKAPSHTDVTKLRAKIIGVASESVLAKVVKARAEAGRASYSS
jgi:hypothetical protein